jgi:hypothetical protein
VTAVIRELQPPQTSILHGDLHLGNVLASSSTGRFVFVDPRGGWSGRLTFDPAYDIAKLLHEPHFLAAQVDLMSRQSKALVEFSEELAAHSAGLLEPTDPLIGARATLLTGVHLVSLLRFPHTVRYNVRTLISGALAWLMAGLDAAAAGSSTAMLRQVWSGLNSSAGNSSRAGAPDAYPT